MKRIPLISILLLAPACVHRVEEAPPPPVPLPESFSAGGEGEPLERWWELFGDPQLDLLVERSLGNNLQLKGAWARLAQADALATQAGSSLWPALNLEAGAATQRSVMRLPTPAGNVDSVIDSTRYQLSLGASYEVDLWGKLRGQRRAALLDLLTTRDNVDALAITLTAQVAETWFALVAVRAQLQLLGDQLHTNETFLELVEMRFANAGATALDVYQQKQRVHASRAAVAAATAQRELLAHQLAVLLGRPPLEGEEPGIGGERADLPELPPLPATGVPALLVQRRPDVRAAQRRVEAADERVGVALANMFPNLRLSASVGYSAASIPDLFSQLVWNAVAGLTQPLFQGGRLKAELDRNRSLLQERVQDYGQTVLQALLEVENALSQERHQQTQLDELRVQEGLARNAVREAKERYTQGLSDFLRVLTAMQTLQQIEQTRLAAERQLLSYRIQLCRALGGSWTGELRPSLVREEEEAK